ncbi:MAG: tRNA (adenosine(37)-N6)-threonylcarbamoyltransferase complex transferase subunit TsaD [Acidobacteria bacterium]|nr:tRNA (adenosine(37)-N6)-threonylcarbamoyltransferase complex transferase subunit TsaD [Acidobacteriota bacterium]MBU2438443.1 tRNA (adenosine(37)-N6)-threonylcarbamoyltransferase complex transferase subunit TsaD [Acidobacteriota bacterium]
MTKKSRPRTGADSRPAVFLGIETSCDETSAALLTEDFEVLGSVVLSQDEIHAPYGGIVPELASRQHIRSIGYVVAECLTRSGRTLSDVDGFAVTQGPGLIGSLLVGLSFAKGLSYCFQKPLYPVDHLSAHIHSVLIEHPSIPVPALALLVSGGHTSIFLMREKLDVVCLAKTRDDAAGEALDKIAKFLDLGYPGGPVIDRIAAEGTAGTFPFSLPQMSDGSADFSFSGLKTAAVRLIREQELNAGHAALPDFLASFQQAVVDALCRNTKKLIRKIRPRSLILVGGVARNSMLRRDFLSLAEQHNIPAAIPSPGYCTDNAAMVAALAVEQYKQGRRPDPALDLNAYSQFQDLRT